MKKFNVAITIEWNSETIFQKDNVRITCNRSNDVCRILAKTIAENDLYGSTAIDKTEVDHWLTYSIGQLCNKNEFPTSIEYLDRFLASRTYLVGKRLTIADFAIFACLYCK